MEDTYQVEGEEMFGYLRGGYTLSQIKEIDQFSQVFGIEFIPCIQTFGHSEQILQVVSS